MAIGLQVVFPEETIELDDIYELPGYTPRALDIRGKDFSRVSEVLINDETAPNFTVLNRSRMLAQVPVSQDWDTVRSVVVLSGALGTTKESILRFRLGTTPKRISGRLRLVQAFVKVMFATPGTDIMNKSLGGGLLRELKTYTGVDGGKGAIGAVAVCIDITTRQIISVQSRQPDLPPSERLAGSKLLEARYIPSDESLNIRFKLISQDGLATYPTVTA